MTYIDKDKALNLDFRINVNLFESRRKTAERAIQAYADAISSIPAADVRPVVLCRDCKYSYDSVGGWCCSHGICVDCIVREDFFCADGERADMREEKMIEGKKILDVTCGDRTIWFQKNEPHTIYCDKRREEWEGLFGKVLDEGGHKRRRHLVINPDVQCDFTDLPFDSCSFSLVVFDPPHIENLSDGAWMRKSYGSLDGDWKPMIRKGFEECMRVLKPDGVLIFKWSDISVSTREILKVIGQEPLFGHRSGKKMNTHWMCFMKFDDCPNCGADMRGEKLMYDELIKALRNNADHYGFEGENGLVHLLTNAADAIEQLTADLERSREWEAFWEKEANEALKKFQTTVTSIPRWIPVTEHKPNEDEEVLIYGEWVGVSGTHYEEVWMTTISDLEHQGYRPIAWMPLPPAPKEESYGV